MTDDPHRDERVYGPAAWPPQPRRASNLELIVVVSVAAAFVLITVGLVIGPRLLAWLR